MIGVAVVPETVGLGWTFLLLFLGFVRHKHALAVVGPWLPADLSDSQLQFVVGASSVSKSMPSCEDLDGKCSMFKALEGMAWVETCVRSPFASHYIGWRADLG